MRVSNQGKRYVVFDDVLSADMAGRVWRAFQGSPMRGSMTGNTRRPLDGVAYRTESAVLEWSFVAEPQDVLDLQLKTIRGCAQQMEDVVGVAGRDWTKLSLTAWSYPTGSQISWHNDGVKTGEHVTGAFVWYVHPAWGPSWGGELLIVDESAHLLVRDAVSRGETSLVGAVSRVTSDGENAVIMGAPDPHCILARPNRLVLIKADTFHAVRRVDPAAGDRSRCSFAGFFFR